ncbi:unnamed protein product [Camellia sinensis]
MYLPLLRDIDAIGQYSWGAAALACLYRMLCRAAQMGTKEIGGSLVLLQIWAWERLIRITPSRRQVVAPGEVSIGQGDMQLPAGPRGSRWRVDMGHEVVSTHVVIVYRDQLDQMIEGEFIWQPYAGVLSTLPDYCRLGEKIWMARVPLICFDVVECISLIVSSDSLVGSSPCRIDATPSGGCMRLVDVAEPTLTRVCIICDIYSCGMPVVTVLYRLTRTMRSSPLPTLTCCGIGGIHTY